MAIAARRRALARSLLGHLGPALTTGAGVGLALVVAQQALGQWAAWPIVLSVPIAMAIMVAAVRTAMERRTILAAAAEIDQRLGLEDRLSTAVAFSARNGHAPALSESDPFVVVALADAERAAQGVDVRRAMPIRLGSSWATWPLLGGLAVIAGTLLPELNLLPTGRPDPQALAQAAARREEVAGQVAKAIETVTNAPTGVPADLASPEQLDRLKQIEAELRAGKTDPEAARDQAARSLEALATRSESEAERQELAADALRRLLAQLPRQGAGNTSPLTRALREGDLRVAREAAESLLNTVKDMEPQEREALAAQLDQLAKDMDALNRAKQASAQATPPAPASGDVRPDEPNPPAAAPSPAPAEPSATDPVLQRDLENQGLSQDQVEKVNQEKGAESAERLLKDLGVDPQTARKLAERVARQRTDQEAQRSAQQRTEDLSRTIKDAADALRGKEPPATPPPPTQPPHAKPPAQPGSGDQPKQGDATNQPGQGENSQPTTEPPKGEPQPGQGTPTEGQRPGGEVKQRPTPSTEGKGTPVQSDNAGPKPGDQSQQGPDAQGKPGSQPEPAGAKPGEPKSGQPVPQPGAPLGQQPGQKQQMGDKPGPTQGEQQGVKPGKVGSAGQPEGQQPHPNADQPRDQSLDQPGFKPGSNPSAVPAPRVGDKRGAHGAEPSADPLHPGSNDPRLDHLTEQLKQAEQTKDQAQRDVRTARELRQIEQKMLENASPEERQRLRQWELQLAKQQSGSEPGTQPGINPLGSPDTSQAPIRTEPVDARPKVQPPPSDQPTQEHVVAEWYSNNKAGADPAATRRDLQESLQRARQSAEQAINERVVPGRYDRLLRQYFRRVPERAVPPAAGPGTAKDAP